jgi:hypothetical protein
VCAAADSGGAGREDLLSELNGAAFGRAGARLRALASLASSPSPPFYR